MKKAIICVDDEAIIVLSIKQELKKHFKDAFIYETALSAEEALEIVKELESDGIQVAVMISDWLMPGMKGDEFLDLLHTRYPEMRLVMVTGQIDKEARERTLARAKADAVLYKPWSSDQLVNAIQKCLTN